MSKKILMLNYEFPPLGGGAGNATYYLLKEFAKYPNLEIDLITSSVDKYKEKQFSDNIKIYYLDIGKKGNLHYQSNKDLLKYSRKAYIFAKKLLKQNKYNLTHAFFGIPCGYIAMKLGLPYIVSLRGSDVPFYNKRFYWLDKLIFKNLSRRIWKKAKRVMANSQGLKNLAQKSDPKQDIEVIYNGIDIEQFQPVLEKNNNEFIVLSTSRFIERKGIEYLIDGFAKFYKKYNNGRLVLAGEGDLLEKFQTRVQVLNMTPAVEFLGAVDHDKLPEIYRQADVFVLPSLNEGMSNSILEAMASGLPIVATDTGGTKELIDGGNGVVVRKENSNDIFRTFEKLYLDKNLLYRMSYESRKKAEKMNWRKAAKEYSKIYKKIYESK